VFHGVGLSKVQAEKVAEAWDGMQATQRQETVTKAEVSSADAVATLKKEWGAAYDQKVAGVEVAAGKLGLTEDHLGGLRSALGPVEAMKFIDMLNGKMGDHNYDSGEPVVSGAMTPEQAKTELNALSSNGEFMTAWLSRSHPGHKDAVAKKSALARQVSGIEA